MNYSTKVNESTSEIKEGLRGIPSYFSPSHKNTLGGGDGNFP